MALKIARSGFILIECSTYAQVCVVEWLSCNSNSVSTNAAQRQISGCCEDGKLLSEGVFASYNHSRVLFWHLTFCFWRETWPTRPLPKSVIAAVFCSVEATVFLSFRKVLVIEDPRGPIYKSLSSDFKSLSLSSNLKFLTTSMTRRFVRRCAVHLKVYRNFLEQWSLSKQYTISFCESSTTLCRRTYWRWGRAYETQIHTYKYCIVYRLMICQSSGASHGTPSVTVIDRLNPRLLLCFIFVVFIFICSEKVHIK